MDPCTNVPLCGINDPVATGTHLLGLGATGVAAFSLWQRTSGHLRTSTAIYALSSALLYLASTAYHASDAGPTREALRQIDHAMVYVLIAGTFTPIVAHLVRDPLRIIVLATVWALAVAGIVLKTCFFGVTPEWLDVTLYVSMGWFAVIPLRQIVRSSRPRAAVWLPFAGTLYSLGALCELFGWPQCIPGVFGGHEVFHLAVLGGSACFYAFVSRDVVGPVIRDAA